jgi:arylsulfatase A-like enzyme
VRIVVADHGEEFGEHGNLLHARRLYDELVRVPLVVSAPGRLPAGVVGGSCSLADVAPTVLELAGVAPAGPLDGRSLLALGAGRAQGRPVTGEEERWVPTTTGGEQRLRVFSVRTELAKYVLTVDQKTNGVVAEELYDLVADPAERRSLPLEGLDRPGPDFCRAVAAVRARVPGFSTKTPCAK